MTSRLAGSRRLPRPGLVAASAAVVAAGLALGWTTAGTAWGWAVGGNAPGPVTGDGVSGLVTGGGVSGSVTGGASVAVAGLAILLAATNGYGKAYSP